MPGLAAKAEAEGVRILSGGEVQSFEFGSNSGAITALNTNQGRLACETVVVGVGPWVNKIWNLLELPKTITVKANGKVRSDVPMWKFWCLEEGTLGVAPPAHRQKVFAGQIPLYKREENSGGLGCFAPDNFPVFDLFRENVYVIAASNHGYKMIGVGRLVAQEVMGDERA